MKAIYHYKSIRFAGATKGRAEDGGSGSTYLNNVHGNTLLGAQRKLVSPEISTSRLVEKALTASIQMRQVGNVILLDD